MSAPMPQELAALLRGTDIATLELRSPGGLYLRVFNDDAQVTVRSANVVARAISPGVLLQSHPLHTRPLCLPGQGVAAGQAIALLRVGHLLLPVTAAQPGTFVRYRVAPGTVVGWGDALADLLSSPPA